jgi:hypothetical protein
MPEKRKSRVPIAECIRGTFSIWPLTLGDNQGGKGDSHS